ncbi:uncharacterized protein K452DRAFT_262792 [Aplosporella prunicola CBS 121167]|uniref:C3H1-type domain-containing protein n=1 Tax=Aplosporella prunicola CBS 121167 TaxID=1176127 RepID=A0A6A6BRK6_9PEZI|nr:uncharacterized protein K452DRAFT_262792 [Aplosporella prunicola CBS 121167]KAF2146726.1 hypothetical protein K452DRAFT_262792 [Aplosporella prunicola CBS 121167]
MVEMSEDSELQAKIAALSGRINLHKQGDNNSGDHFYYEPQAYRGRGRGRGSANWAPYRGTPYGSPRGRGGRVHHRSLVLNNSKASPAGSNSAQGSTSPTEGSTVAAAQVTDGSGWIVKRDRHMQLINPAIYDQVALQRTKAMEQSEEERRQQRDMKEKAKLTKHFQGVHTPPGPVPAGVSSVPSSQQAYEMDINGIRFRVADGGSKLIRVSDDPKTARVTPKQTKVGGVVFLRSKNGNLYRSGLVKTKQKKTIKINEPCPRFSTTGTCSRGPQCRYVHDPHKVAICKDYLLKGKCPLGAACDLSHDSTANRVPACLHFLRGNCTNDNCRYAHVRVNPSASVCRAFAAYGYCEKGAECAERHVFECPDYANHAVCRNKRCRLPHVDRAGQIRKATAAQASTAEEEDGSPDLSSDEDYDEIDSDDVDSDGLGEDVIMQGSDDHGHELSQQKDFIGFG